MRAIESDSLYVTRHRLSGKPRFASTCPHGWIHIVLRRSRVWDLQLGHTMDARPGRSISCISSGDLGRLLCIGIGRSNRALFEWRRCDQLLRDRVTAYGP